MKEQSFAFLQQWFYDYVRAYHSDDSDVELHVRLKVEHTWRVVDYGTAIAESLGLPADEARLVRTAALFHDIGRFKQYHIYRTFNDRLSVDHAALGLQVLNEANVLGQAGATKQEREWINRAVLYHNRRNLPEEDQTCLLYAKILRDADKLDIYDIIVRGEMPCSREYAADHAVSAKVVQDLLKGKMACFEDIQSAADQMLFRMSWIYNLYFRYSLACVLERRYLEKMMDRLPADEQVKQVYERLLRYLHARVQEDGTEGDPSCM
jgi:putative nucleotidyltransferase with HDIG domain